MSNEARLTYFAQLERRGLVLRHTGHGQIDVPWRLLAVAHARAWFTSLITSHSPQEWQAFRDFCGALPAQEGLRMASITSWLQRWHIDVPWAWRWFVSAAFAMRRGDPRGGTFSRDQLLAYERELALQPPATLSVDLSDFGVWRDDLDEERGPDPSAETEEAFLVRAKRAYEQRRDRSRLPWPGLVMPRDAEWFVRYQVGREDLSSIDVPPNGSIRRSIDTVLMEFALLINVPPRTSLPSAFTHR